MFDLIIRGGEVVTPNGVVDSDVAIAGETIAALTAPGTLDAGSAARVIDAAGHIVMPGGIDPHVHYAMNFEHILITEGPPYSFAAALGGNTSVIDFVFQEPPQGLLDANAKLRYLSPKRIDLRVQLRVLDTPDHFIERSFNSLQDVGDK